MTHHVASRFATGVAAVIASCAGAVPGQKLGATWGTGRAEADYYRVVDLPLPRPLAIEAGSFCMMPDGRLAVGTRRGDIYLVSGAFQPVPQPRLHCYASGLDEVLGLGYRDGAFYATQQTEVTRITDVDGDERADRFDTLSDAWGFEHYHEFAWGSPPDAEGNIWIVLGLSSSYHYRAKFRGWGFKITPGGEAIPVVSGIRSAGGVAPNEHGVMFYTESQGPWNGSCSLKHLRPGGFMGHPISFDAYEFAPNMGPKPVEPKSGSRLATEVERVEQLVPYAVVFPYRKMGQSITGFRVDRTGGKFGPFAGQSLRRRLQPEHRHAGHHRADQRGWQGACYPFREGLGTGILALEFSPKGYLVTGGTNRGWPVRGSRQFVLERVEWTGKTPFRDQGDPHPTAGIRGRVHPTRRSRGRRATEQLQVARVHPHLPQTLRQPRGGQDDAGGRQGRRRTGRTERPARGRQAGARSCARIRSCAVEIGGGRGAAAHCRVLHRQSDPEVGEADRPRTAVL